MKIFTTVLFLCLYTGYKAQFLHPTTGINGEYVGACETATCGGTYLDDGGSGSNYALNTSATYRVFCPNTAGNCIRLTFTSFDVEFQGTCSWDYLTVGNGPTQNSPVFTSSPANNTGRICGTPATPFAFTSTDASGCLTVRFTSDGTINRPGWSANLSCVPCSGGPSGTTNADCQFATPICTNASVVANSTGPGIVAEGCSTGNCPAGGENYSNWYQVLIGSSGTLNFTITPSNLTADFDYAVYGPNTSCGALGLPVRCNDSGNPGPTGLSIIGLNTSENAAGSTWCSSMNVTAGQSYFIVVDSWSPPSGGYSLNWGGTATFNCSILPVELVRFDALYNTGSKQTDISWSTAVESHVDRYLVERSTDGTRFSELGVVKPYQSDSRSLNTYTFADLHPLSNEINYYRIVTVDDDGTRNLSSMQAVAFQDDDANLRLVPNPAGESVELNFKSLENENWEICIYDGRGIRRKKYTSLLR
jgi:hypothetical protein